MAKAFHMALMMAALFALTGLNVWQIIEDNGGVFSYTGAAIGIGFSAYIIGAFVKED